MAERPAHTLLTNKLSSAQEALDSPEYDRVRYLPGSPEDRASMVSGLSEDPGTEAVNVEGIDFRISDLPPNQAAYDKMRQKPSDKDLSAWEQWKEFLPEARKQIGIDPEIVYQDALNERHEKIKQSYSRSDWALLRPEDRLKHQATAEAYAAHMRDRAEAKVQQELTFAKSAFDKAISQREEQVKHERNQAEAKKLSTDDQRLENALSSKLGRKPTDQEFINAKQSAAIEIASAKASAVEKGKGVGGFIEWKPEAKNQAFMYNLITKEPPASAKGMASGDRKIYSKEYTQWQVDQGYTPQVVAALQADYKAGSMSLNNMAKQEAPMAAFVGNINKQIERVQELYSNNDRVGLRFLDLPIRELKVKAMGSGLEAVRASYLLEISNEIGKLSSGASASVQQLSDSAKEDWKKVHDPNLSLGEIMKVVNATRDQANMRMQSWRDAKEEVRTQLRSIGTPEKPTQAGAAANQRTVVEKRKTASGKILTKYSDGSIE